jgi:hypothetical protein
VGRVSVSETDWNGKDVDHIKILSLEWILPQPSSFGPNCTTPIYNETWQQSFVQLLLQDWNLRVAETSTMQKQNTVISDRGSKAFTSMAFRWPSLRPKSPDVRHRHTSDPHLQQALQNPIPKPVSLNWTAPAQLKKPSATLTEDTCGTLHSLHRLRTFQQSGTDQPDSSQIDEERKKDKKSWSVRTWGWPRPCRTPIQAGNLLRKTEQRTEASECNLD